MEIVLIPGFMLDRDLWRDMRPTLEQMGRVIDVDTAQDDTIAGMADRALAAMYGPALVVGFSMGGYVAREIAYRAQGKVAALALVATSSRASPARAVADPARFRQLGHSAVMRSLHPDHRDEAILDRLVAMSRRLGGEAFRRQSGLARNGDTDRLGEIRCPTLVVSAAQDELRLIDEAPELHAGIAGSTLRVIEHCGHMIPIERPSELLALLRGLAKTKADTR
ncbi:alpha/beta fold hydrolase [Sphingobium vermicomposti]|uniref:Pimeloyl-ACP methyl ester carboxylesterase n=1 Tax=Sphingobium vermicomposti TaxID=529005 RepID=A0A846M921_9SPHN|nr:alpha/beta fold hydrolase [Sphingobium vermicomposti]NIJ17943.1 pimeloyl-ACP methyl ester carboxylesterase [Sphingobium vermicomposti]